MKTILMVFLLLLCTLPLGAAQETAQNYYDLVVVGSDPEGIAAAVAGARNGLKTALICHRHRLGGLMTLGGLNTLDMNYGPDGQLLTQGIFQEFFEQLEGHSFDITTAEEVFNSMVSGEDITLHLGVQSITPVRWQNNRIIGLTFEQDGQSTFYSTDTIVDATQDAVFAKAAGVEFTIGREDYGGPPQGMGATLIFGVEGVDWGGISAGIRSAGIPNTGVDGTSAWGFWNEMQAYEPKDPLIGFRGLNIGRQNDGSVLINAMYIFDFDHLDPEERIEARERGKAELEYLIPHMQKHIPGFENATLSHICEELYIRETRHMIGLYRLTIDDVLEHRDFWDKVAWGSYPVDIQDFSPDERGFVVGRPLAYSIPFRSLIPLSIEGLIVVGRSASYDSLAHGSARVIPVGMATGEAAGVAASLRSEFPGQSWQSLAENTDFIHELQERLQEQGAYLPDLDLPHPLEGHWAYEAVKNIRGMGLLSAGYDNNYRLDEILNGPAMQNLFNNMLKRLYGSEFSFFYTRARAHITLEEMARMFLGPLQKQVQDQKEALAKARELDLIPEELPDEAITSGPMDRATLYYLLSHYLDRLLMMIPPPNTTSPS